MDPHPRVMLALARMKHLFLECPESRLTTRQAADACAIDRDLCERVLLALSDVRFLIRDAEGHFSRRYLESDLDFDGAMA